MSAPQGLAVFMMAVTWVAASYGYLMHRRTNLRKARRCLNIMHYNLALAWLLWWGGLWS